MGVSDCGILNSFVMCIINLTALNPPPHCHSVLLWFQMKKKIFEVQMYRSTLFRLRSDSDTYVPIPPLMYVYVFCYYFYCFELLFFSVVPLCVNTHKAEATPTQRFYISNVFQKKFTWTLCLSSRTKREQKQILGFQINYLNFECKNCKNKHLHCQR